MKAQFGKLKAEESDQVLLNPMCENEGKPSCLPIPQAPPAQGTREPLRFERDGFRIKEMLQN